MDKKRKPSPETIGLPGFPMTLRSALGWVVTGRNGPSSLLGQRIAAMRGLAVLALISCW